MNDLVLREPEEGCSARCCREDSYGCPLVPALTNVLLSHAHSYPWPYLVASYCRGEKVTAAQTCPNLSQCAQRRQGDGTDMHHAHTMNVVELKSLHQGPVDESGMRC